MISLNAFRRKDGNDDMTNDYSADAAAFSARDAVRKVVLESRDWIDVFLSGKDARLFLRNSNKSD